MKNIIIKNFQNPAVSIYDAPSVKSPAPPTEKYELLKNYYNKYCILMIL